MMMKSYLMMTKVLKAVDHNALGVCSIKAPMTLFKVQKKIYYLARLIYIRTTHPAAMVLSTQLKLIVWKNFMGS